LTTFVQLTDLHLRPRGAPALRIAESNMLTARAVKAVRALSPAPDAVIVTGDVTDTGDPREYAVAKELLGALPVPVYVMPGNHDNARELRTAFADWPGVRNAPADHFSYTADIGKIRLVALDTAVEGKPYGQLGATQLAWLDARLGEAADRPTVIAMHHPPIRTGLAHMDTYDLRDGADLAEVVGRHRHVERILTGHVHRLIVSAFAGTSVMIMPGVSHQVELTLEPEARAQIVLEPPAYGIHTWIGSSLVSHMAYVESYPGPYPFNPDQGVSWPGY